MRQRYSWEQGLGSMLPRLSFDIVPDNDVYVNDSTVQGAPAFRLLGNNIRFTNSDIGRIRADGDGDSAIVLVGTGNTIVNAAGGVIRNAANNFNSLAAPVILGSSGADRIEASGVIIGKVELGGGDDAFLSLSGDSAWDRRVNLGEGDDSFFLLPTTSISLTPYVDGGPGVDRYISLAGTGNFNGSDVTNVEILELRSDSFVGDFRGTSLTRVEVNFADPTRFFNALRFFNTPNADVVILEAANGYAGGLSVYDRSTIRSLTGSDIMDQITIANDTILPGAIALGGGDDSLSIKGSQYSNPLQTRIGSSIDGGAGFDRLTLQLRNGAVLELDHAVNFEELSVFNAGPSNGEPLGDGLFLRGVRTIAQVVIFQQSLVTLESSDISGTIELYELSRLNIAADASVGGIKPRGLYGNPQLADDTKSTTVVNSGRVTGVIQFGVGDDVLDGSNSLSAQVAIGGAGNDRLTGGAFADRLEGGLGGDTLIGGGGNDSLDGGGSSDLLNGGAGDDWMVGGDGSDFYIVDSQNDVVVETGYFEGDDQVQSTTSYYLYDFVDRLYLYDSAGAAFGVGNSLSNIIYGNASANLLIGGAGGDLLYGYDGNDQLFGESDDDQLYGFNGIDYLVGGTGNDNLLGGADADALYGEDGNDTLDGGASFDTDIMVGGNGDDILRAAGGLGDYDLLDGGAGNDSYYVDTPNDLTFEAVGGGTDTVYANINGAGYYLFANTENLVLEGNTPFGVGNELANSLTGNVYGNYLLGGAGNDTINGKPGNDVLFGEGGADTFVFERGTDDDVVGDFQAGVDKIRLVGLGFASFAQLQGAFVENGGTTAIDLGQGDIVVLTGVTNAQLSATDFLFG